MRIHPGTGDERHRRLTRLLNLLERGDKFSRALVLTIDPPFQWCPFEQRTETGRFLERGQASELTSVPSEVRSWLGGPVARDVRPWRQTVASSKFET